MNSNKPFILGIDASRNRSGGAIAYLKGILSEFSFESDIRQVHIWGSESLLCSLPNAPWLFKHTHHLLEKSVLHQLFWQLFILRYELNDNNCDVLFSPDATSLCYFPKHIVLSQDLLSYEPVAFGEYEWGRDKLRLKIIKVIQNYAFKRAHGVLFLTKYAADLVQQYCGVLPNIGFSPHGVDHIFNRIPFDAKFPLNEKSISCIYVSSSDLYKNQWHVVKAISKLRDTGLNLSLTLIGGAGTGNDLLVDSIYECNASDWVCRYDFVEHYKLPDFLAKSDIFIFASSCENLPITLLEGMAFSLPIACSNIGPMPEVLLDGGVYFDPTSSDSIANSISLLIKNEEFRLHCSFMASHHSKSYTWKSCSQKTFGFIIDTYLKSIQQ